jgi:hypothetical protein
MFLPLNVTVGREADFPFVWSPFYTNGGRLRIDM